MKKQYIKPQSVIKGLYVACPFLEESRYGITSDYSESRQEANDRRFDWDTEEEE